MLAGLQEIHLKRIKAYDNEYEEPSRRKTPNTRSPLPIFSSPTRKIIVPRSPRSTSNTDISKPRPVAPDRSPLGLSGTTINVGGTFQEINVVPSSQSEYTSPPATSNYRTDYSSNSTYTLSTVGSIRTFSDPSSSSALPQLGTALVEPQSPSAPPSPQEPGPANPEDSRQVFDTVISSIFSGVDEQELPPAPASPKERIIVPMNPSFRAWDYSSFDLAPRQREAVRDAINAYEALADAVEASVPVTRQLEAAMFDRAAGTPDTRRSEHAITSLQRVSRRLTEICTRLKEKEEVLVKLRGYRLHGLDFALRVDQQSLVASKPGIITAKPYPTFKRIDIAKLPLLAPTSNAFREGFIR
ncbi:hypothetical protein TWF718_000543 [Orbilia javanica]|uniref:Uncharacterized protein n=1 Tax=Orbilia javanica TaxID=47235 RepID=A0AAN8N4G4_9PEZI